MSYSPRCLASNATDTAASALHALRGAAAAFVHEATAAVDAAFGDGNATGAAARRLGAPPTARVTWQDGWDMDII